MYFIPKEIATTIAIKIINEKRPYDIPKKYAAPLRNPICI
jgi:hypothetical protein